MATMGTTFSPEDWQMIMEVALKVDSLRELWFNTDRPYNPSMGGELSSGAAQMRENSMYGNASCMIPSQEFSSSMVPPSSIPSTVTWVANAAFSGGVEPHRSYTVPMPSDRPVLTPLNIPETYLSPAPSPAFTYQATTNAAFFEVSPVSRHHPGLVPATPRRSDIYSPSSPYALPKSPLSVT